MSSGGSKVQQVPTTTTTTNEPWAEQKPYLETGFERAGDVLNTPTEYFPGNTVVPFSEQTEQGLQMQENRALGGSPLNALAQSGAMETMGGDYLSAGNPYFSDMATRIDATIRPQVQSAFEGAGRGRSAGVQEAYTRAMGDAMAPLAFQSYGDERDRMLRTQAGAADMAQTDYQDIGQLMASGQTREAMDREGIADQMARFNYAQTEPSNRLAQYMGLISGSYGGTGTTQGTTPYYQQSSNPLLTGLGAVSGLGGLLGFCWVARAVYGDSDPRWREFRVWLLSCAPQWLYRLYLKRGPSVARFVRRHPSTKLVLRPLMDLARWSIRGKIRYAST